MEDSIQIQVNGEQRGCRADATVGDLLRELAIKTERVAVELNLEIMDRKDFDHRSLKQGDRLEILSFIGGGSTGWESGSIVNRIQGDALGGHYDR